MALMIAAERSGAGKTTVTLALLSFLAQQSDRVQSFKVGPDYIDPLFHTAITGRACRNLDPVLTSPTYVQRCWARHCQSADYALVEGVMGLFDGIHSHGVWDYASTAHVARLLNLPLLLVLDCRRLSGSVAALVHGYRTLDPRLALAGVILNQVASDRHLQLLEAALAPLNVPIMGVLRRDRQLILAERHLGLVPVAELDHLPALQDHLAAIAQTSFQWRSLLPLLEAPRPPSSESALAPVTAHPVRIAVACDRAFSFYYQDNLDLLQALGAEVVAWSPLQDAALPPETEGLYLGGGFPEVFAEALADNQSAHQSVRQFIQSGKPTYAECGGLMYLCEQIVDLQGQAWPMIGILPTLARLTPCLTLGYRRGTVLKNSFLLQVGETVCAHEFHRSQLQDAPHSPLFSLQRYEHSSQLGFDGWQVAQVHASYLHLHFGHWPLPLDRFVRRCELAPAPRGHFHHA